MEKIKAALHIHDKTQVPNDGAVGNIQNPSASDPNGPTAAELWGAGNKDTVYHPNRKADTVAAAAAEAAKVGYSNLITLRLKVHDLFAKIGFGMTGTFSAHTGVSRFAR